MNTIDTNIVYVEFNNTLRVTYQGIYMGRIVEDDTKFRFENRYYRQFKYNVDFPEFDTLEVAKAYCEGEINTEIRNKKENLYLDIDALTPLGKDFMRKFKDGPVQNKDLSPEEKSAAKGFVLAGFLERGRNDNKDKTIYYVMEDNIKALVQPYLVTGKIKYPKGK